MRNFAMKNFALIHCLYFCNSLFCKN